MKYHDLFKIILLSVILFINPNFTKARQVTNNIRIDVSFNSAQGEVEGFCHSSEARDGKCPINKKVGDRVYRSTFNNIGTGSNNPVQETLVANLTKNVDLQKGGANMNSSFNMLVGETTNLRTSATTGSWSVQSRSVGANMNGQRYRIYRTGDLDLNKTRKTLEGAVSAPRDNNSPNLSSSNNSVISCSGTTCTARGAGTATIRASFPNNSGTVNSRFWYEEATRFMRCAGVGACGQGRGAYFYKVNSFLTSQKDFSANYSFPDITWNVTVTSPNQAPTVSLTKAAATSTTEAILEWLYRDNENNPQARYHIQIARNNNFGYRQFDSTITNSNNRQQVIRNLIPGTQYYARIRVSDSHDPNRFSAWSNVREFTTLNPPNQAPTVNLTRASATGNTTATLEWNYRDGENDRQAKYTIQISTERNFRDIQFEGTVTNSNRRQQNITGLTSGTKYYARIRVSDSHDPNRFSAWSNVREFTTLNPPNQAPTVNLTRASATGNTTATLEWNYRDGENDRQAKYTIQISTERNFRDIQFEGTVTNSNRRQQNITGLTSGTKYYARIRVSDSHDPNRFSAWSNVREFRTSNESNKTPTVELTKAEATGEKTATLEWLYRDGENNPQAKYQIQISTGNNFSDIQFENEFTNSNKRQQNITGLTPGTEYYARIRVSDSYDPNRFSRWSNVERFTTNQDTSPEVGTVTISCRLSRRTVSSASPTVQIQEISVGGTSNYEWRIRQSGTTFDSNDFSPAPIGATQTLNYAGIQFGQYTPTIEIKSNGNITSQTCGPLTNLGNNTVKEIAP